LRFSAPLICDCDQERDVDQAPAENEERLQEEESALAEEEAVSDHGVDANPVGCSLLRDIFIQHFFSSCAHSTIRLRSKPKWMTK